jgi:hypothetical protein
MTIFVYVNTAKQVGDKITSSFSRTPKPRRSGSRRTIPRALRSNTRFLNEPDRPQDGLCHADDRGASGHLADSRSALRSPPNPGISYVPD